jgi:hypothetical protein
VSDGTVKRHPTQTRLQWSTEALRRALIRVPPRARNLVGSGTPVATRLLYVGWRDPRVGGL